MIRLTRLINSPESRLFLTSAAPRRNLSPSTHTFFSSPIPHLKFSPHLPQLYVHLHRRCLFSSPNTPFRTPPAMESSGGYDTFPPEDFVHVVNPDDAIAEMSVDEPNPIPAPASPSTHLPDGVAAPAAAAAEEDASGGDDPPSVREPEEGLGRQRAVLPEELARRVVVLECESSAEGGSCEVYLVGTAHVSKESCREVQAVISYLKPQVVFLELCSSRVAILTLHDLKIPTVKEMIDMWKKKKMNPFGILYSWFLAKVADKLEVLPGSEFRVAFEEAMSYGAKVILGDRPVEITLRRTWGKMPLWHKIKFLYHMLFQAIFIPSPEDLNKLLKEMDDVDMLTLVIQEMSKEFPTLMEMLLHERDLYMSSTLLKVASEHASVVAVVGKGHLQGIKKHWKQPVEVKDLLETPANSGRSTMNILQAIGVAAAGVAIISGIYLAGKR